MGWIVCGGGVGLFMYGRKTGSNWKLVAGVLVAALGLAIALLRAYVNGVNSGAL